MPILDKSSPIWGLWVRGLDSRPFHAYNFRSEFRPVFRPPILYSRLFYTTNKMLVEVGQSSIKD